MKRRRTLITSPLEWQMTAAPVPAPRIPVLAERSGTQLKVPKPVLLVDTREQNPLDCSRFTGWFAGIEKRALNSEIIPSPGWRMCAWWSGGACRIWSIHLPPIVPYLFLVFGGWPATPIGFW